ncbi:hypothetical protein L1987_31798 [Smallanthus sonchifolius]|uniref:Uncharacterized protein n=1 Tax=Smallanthus sonchifolius TaxID=185202 RepID=A0ACB9I6M8_9ASTR|nr:hypothetical protein L1987_31798 [Smallanthus sonchifolius]
MTIDKSWIALRDRNHPDFIKGLQKFIDNAKNYVDEDGKIYCPCKKCANSYRQSLSFVYSHVRVNGFLQAYDTWFYHGEEYVNASDVDALWTTNTSVAATDHEMFDALDDVMAEQNTHEENTYEDGSGAGLDPEFEALFEELRTELYPGCSWMSSLNFLTKLMHIKVMNKWTNTSFNQLLELLRIALPKENHIPESHYESKKKLRKIGWSNAPQWPQISAGIHDDCARRFRERKSVIKRHFESVGGYDDVEEARNRPNESISSDNWNSLIDIL